jgi:hypothetical protein
VGVAVTMVVAALAPQSDWAQYRPPSATFGSTSLVNGGGKISHTLSISSPACRGGGERSEPRGALRTAG